MIAYRICPACGTKTADSPPGFRMDCGNCGRVLRQGQAAAPVLDVLPAEDEVADVLPAELDTAAAYQFGAQLVAKGGTAPWLSRQLVSRGVAPATAAWVEYELLAERARQRQRSGWIALGLGILLGLIGMFVTVVSLVSAGSGRKFIVATGAIAAGIANVIRGLYLLGTVGTVPPQPRTPSPRQQIVPPTPPKRAEVDLSRYELADEAATVPHGVAIQRLSIPAPAQPILTPVAAGSIPTLTRPTRRHWLIAAGAGGGLVLLALLGLAAFLVLRSPAGATTSPAVVAVPTASEQLSSDWLVLFRADDPRLWNRDVNEGANRFARSLASVPETIRYLRVRKGDDYVIIPMRKDKLDQTWDIDEFGWEGSNHTDSGSHHLGVFSHKQSAHNQGDISIRIIPWCRGWGFGHRAFLNDVQGYCWEGKAIPAVVLEIAVKPRDLTAAERKRLLTGKPVD